MVRKIAVPARNSVVKVEFRSASLNRLPSRELATKAFSLDKGFWLGEGDPASMSMTMKN